MSREAPIFQVSIAETRTEIAAAQRLRYEVFVKELGADGPMIDHAAGLERDRFDDFATHILLRDKHRSPDDQIVGAYRVMTPADAARAGQFYCADEYDLAPLTQGGLRLMELGRSCIHKDYRGGPGLMHLWSGIADLVAAQKTDVLFGVASFHGTDVHALAAPLSLLHDRHLAPPPLRVGARQPGHHAMNLVPPDDIDRLAVMRQIPALIKAYLRLGAVVGDGAFIDHAFNTTDICLILATDAIGAMQRRIYARGRGLG
ncbi:GNAT family N-acetyltransferase [Yoonia sp. 2307UL14-13]|uniref:GNAT family N-acetyltransferase n=1 Tax=Yoonia sp. 2307UL14-13 TaxID=3126506 RepID=UPI0030A01E7D